MHRSSGNVEELGVPEEWLKLPKTRRTLKSKPAKLCITVFGNFPERASSSQQGAVRSSVVAGMPAVPMSVSAPKGLSDPRPKEDVSGKRRLESDPDSEKRHKGDISEETEKLLNPNPDAVGVQGDSVGEYVGSFPPKYVAKHGPRFLELTKLEREWIQRVHQRMGHPDPARFAKFLKDTHAEPKIIAGALEFQCDTCTETAQGYASARPAAIHPHLSFNDVVGVDVAFWKNDQGESFPFVHFLDEGTLFHLGSSCAETSESQIDCFENSWLSWAGPPKQLYLDPASCYTSELWLDRMQSEDIALKMTATDSHWQLGRVESHGRIVKRMLDRMSHDNPIRNKTEFAKALRQVFMAKNAMSRVQGYSPEQAVLGIARRLPASVISSEQTGSHEVATSDTSEGDVFRQALDLRTSARRAFVEADNCGSLRRALLRRSRPMREAYEVGDWVLYWKKKGGNMRRERGRWYGPARVAMVEGSKVVWLTHANRLIRASPEQLRSASLREWKEVKQIEDQGLPMREVLQKAQHQNYFDLGNEIPTAEDVVSDGYSPSIGESLPEPEQAPSDTFQDSDLGNQELSPPVETSPNPVDVPVPEAAEGELDSQHEDDILFGDAFDWDDSWTDRYWEIDITPGSECDSGTYWDWMTSTDQDVDETVFLATEMRKKRVEVKLKDLGEKDQHLFAVAKNKEVKAWLHHNTVRKVAKGKIPENALMRCRWLLSWKSATGDESPQELSTQGQRAKARMVIIGFEDPDIDTVSNDAPTLSKDGRMVVLQSVASNKWELISFDVSTAFLHGKGDGRVLGIHPPPELKEALGMSEEDQCALDGGAYGRIDAPYLWFCEFRDELLRQGCTQCPLDPCVFGLYSTDKHGQQKCHGILGIHVDDGIAGGDSVFHAMLKRVESRFKFGAFEKGEFKYTGIHFKQWDDCSIEYDQVAYVEKISPISVEKSRKQQLDSPVTETERSSLRSLVGALQYAAVHSRPDIAAKVGELQSSVVKATVADLLTANKVLAEAKQHKVSLMVLPIAPEEVTFCAFSDASFASNRQYSAHQGTLIFVTTPKLLDNQKSVVAPIAWASKKVPRVVRSTLGAEAAALSNTVDRLMWLRIMWAWVRNPQCTWQKPEEALNGENTSALVTDCKSAYDLLTRTALPQCAEHRTTIECLLIRERLKENCRVRWVCSQAMLADCLTKTMDSQVLRECLRTGRYSLQDEACVLKNRSDNRQRLEWIKSQAQSPIEPSKADTEPTVLYSSNVTLPMQDFWTRGSHGELIRVHQKPRRTKFTPIGVPNCPVELRDLDVRRVTQVGRNRIETDFWVGTRAYQDLGQSWTGTTTFFLKPMGK